MATSPWRRLAAGLAAAGAGLALASLPAAAHVGVSGTVSQGGYGRATFSVPNERDDASTVKVEVKVPDEHAIASLRTQPKAGWTATVAMRTLDEPIQQGDREITEVVDTITWEGGKIGPGEFELFDISGGPFPEGVDALALPTVQTYDSGEEVSWIEVADEGSEEEPEHPAPVLKLLPPAEDDHGDGATTTTEVGADGDSSDAPDGAEAVEVEDDDSSTGLAVAGLVAGLGGLAMGGAALAKSRR